MTAVADGEERVGNPGFLRFARRLQIALMLDHGRWKPGLELMRADVPDLDRAEDDEHYERMISLYASYAFQMGVDRPEVLALIEELCREEVRFIDRAEIVQHAARFYRMEERDQDAVRFLQGELERPAVAGDPKLKGQLTDLLEGAQDRLERPKIFREAVADWLAVHKPSWFDHVEPRRLRKNDLEAGGGVTLCRGNAVARTGVLPGLHPGGPLGRGKDLGGGDRLPPGGGHVRGLDQLGAAAFLGHHGDSR